MDRHILVFRRIFLFFSFSVLMFSCQKETTPPFKQVQYFVTVYPGNEVGILYNSDYAVDTGNKKEITINDANNHYSNYTWLATHIQKENEPYYIKVRYKVYNNPSNLSYGVFVYVNDTLVDKVIKNAYVPEIELTGTVE